MEKGDAMVRQSSESHSRSKPGAGRRLRGEVQAHYEMLLHRLPWPSTGSTSAPRTLGVSSCEDGEGVSTVAAHLAVTAAAMGAHRILLVDANFAQPCVPRIFGVRGRPGLAEVLQSRCGLGDVLQTSAVENLSLLVSGRPAGPYSAVYDAEGMQGLIKELAGEFDLVVVDLPAARQSSAALRLARRLDGILMVVEAGRVRRDVAQRVSEVLVRAGARPLGAVLNKWQQRVPAWLSCVR